MNNRVGIYVYFLTFSSRNLLSLMETNENKASLATIPLGVCAGLEGWGRLYMVWPK